MLTVTIIRCSNLRNVARVIRQDPFVCLSVPTSQPNILITKKTSVAVAGGVNPTWLFKNKLRLKVQKGNVEVAVQVWDKEVFQNNRLIGEGKLSLKDFEEDGCEEEPKDIDIYFEGINTLATRVIKRGYLKNKTSIVNINNHIQKTTKTIYVANVVQKIHYSS